MPWTARQAVIGTVVALSLLFGWQLAFAGLDLLGIVDVRERIGLILPWGHLLMAASVWWLIRRWYGVGFPSLGFRAVSPWLAFRLLGQALVIGYAALFVFGIVVYTFTGRAAQENLLPAFGGGPEGLVAAAVSASVIAPMTEELVFRGFLFAGLRGRFGVVVAVLLSSLVFALSHLMLLAFPALLALGAILAWLYHRSGSLWPSIVLHATVNTVTLLVWYAQSNGFIPPA